MEKSTANVMSKHAEV